MTKEELEGVKTLLPFLAIKHIDPQPFADVITALEQAWAERYDALAELQRMKDRPCEQEFSRVDRMWNSLVAERDALKKENDRLNGAWSTLKTKVEGLEKKGRVRAIAVVGTAWK